MSLRSNTSLTKLMWMRTWCVLLFFVVVVVVGSLKESLQESEKWSFTAGWGGCEEGDGIFSHLRELNWPFSGCPLSGGHCSGWMPFPKGRGVGWSQIHVLVSRMRWEHLSFPSVTVFVGKNREAQHEFMLFIWWYQIISFWSSVIFIWDGGRVSAPRI